MRASGNIISKSDACLTWLGFTNPAYWWASQAVCATNHGPLCTAAWRRQAPHRPQTSRQPLSQGWHADPKKGMFIRQGDTGGSIYSQRRYSSLLQAWCFQANTHIILQKTEVLSAKRAFRHWRHLMQVECGQADSRSLSVNEQWWKSNVRRIKTKRGKARKKSGGITSGLFDLQDHFSSCFWDSAMLGVLLSLRAQPPCLRGVVGWSFTQF